MEELSKCVKDILIAYQHQNISYLKDCLASFKRYLDFTCGQPQSIAQRIQNIFDYTYKGDLSIAVTLLLDYDHSNDFDRGKYVGYAFYCMIDQIRSMKKGAYMNLFLLLDSGHEVLDENMSRFMSENSMFTEEDKRNGAQHLIMQIAKVAIKKVQASGFDITDFPFGTYEYSVKCLDVDISNTSEEMIMRKAFAFADSVETTLRNRLKECS